MLLTSACGFSLRQNIQAVDTVTYRLNVETREPAVGHAISSAMRNAGFKVSMHSADAEVRIIDEEITHDELTPDTYGAMQTRTIIYRFRFGVYGIDGSTIIKPRTLELTTTSVGQMGDDQIEDTHYRKGLEELRRQAAQLIISILQSHVDQIAERVN